MEVWSDSAPGRRVIGGGGKGFIGDIFLPSLLVRSDVLKDRIAFFSL